MRRSSAFFKLGLRTFDLTLKRISVLVLIILSALHFAINIYGRARQEQSNLSTTVHSFKQNKMKNEKFEHVLVVFFAKTP